MRSAGASIVHVFLGRMLSICRLGLSHPLFLSHEKRGGSQTPKAPCNISECIFREFQPRSSRCKHLEFIIEIHITVGLRAKSGSVHTRRKSLTATQHAGFFPFHQFEYGPASAPCLCLLQARHQAYSGARLVHLGQTLWKQELQYSAHGARQ